MQFLAITECIVCYPPHRNFGLIGLLIKNSTDEYLTKNTQKDAGKELQTIAHQLCHTDKESFVGMLEEWYERWGEWLKHRTLDKNTGKKTYTHRRVRSAYFSMKRHMKWLWTWYDNIDITIPNTNNILEAINTDLKTKLWVHNGMSKRYRKLFIDEYFKLKYKYTNAGVYPHLCTIFDQSASSVGFTT